jgi:hypothetical protein
LTRRPEPSDERFGNVLGKKHWIGERQIHDAVRVVLVLPMRVHLISGEYSSMSMKQVCIIGAVDM